MQIQFTKLLLATLLASTLAGCVATSPFPIAARSGDTVVLPVGRVIGLSRKNITVTIAPAAGPAINYGPNDPRVRAVLNLYPDPVSRLVVGTETQQSLGQDADVYGGMVNEQLTGRDKDWWETILYFDLPRPLAEGTAKVTINGPQGPINSQPALIEVLPGSGGQYNPALGLFDGNQVQNILGLLERADHFTVNIRGKTVPHSIQIELARSAGVGKPWVANPRGDIKNATWSDDGAKIKILLTPTHGQTLAALADFKFYVAGNVTGLRLASLKAYDVNGKPIADISADIE
jgi:hypothetical protein